MHGYKAHSRQQYVTKYVLVGVAATVVFTAASSPPSIRYMSAVSVQRVHLFCAVHERSVRCCLHSTNAWSTSAVCTVQRIHVTTPGREQTTDTTD